MAVKLEKRLTAREIRGKKKHKMLWCLEIWKGYVEAGNAPFVSGCTLVRKRSRVRVPPSAPLKKATVYRAFFFFRNSENQLTKFNWLSEKRPLAVRCIVKTRLKFSQIPQPFPTCPNRPKTPYFSPIGYIWLSKEKMCLAITLTSCSRYGKNTL